MRLSWLRILIPFFLYACSDAFRETQTKASVESCLDTIGSLQRRVFFKMIPGVFNSIMQGKFGNIHDETIDLLKVWATDLCDHCCIKTESETNKQGVETMKGHLGKANDLFRKLNKWLESIHFDKTILGPYQPVISKFETWVNCLVEQVPKDSREFNLEIETLLTTFKRLKKAFT